MSKKYNVAFQYTVWVDVEADSEEEAIEKAIEVPYNYVDVHETGATMELNEFDDPRVYEEME